MGVLFDLCRERVTAREAAEAYGLTVDRYGKALCPWHDDSRPSLSFKGNLCKCFACGSGGSAIDLTAQLYGLTPLEAARKLNSDFRLGADETPSQRPAGPSNAQLREQAKRVLRMIYGSLCDRERACKAILATFGPNDAYCPEYLERLKELATTQDLIERINMNGMEALKQWEIPSTH